jgi:hypothetical protein
LVSSNSSFSFDLQILITIFKGERRVWRYQNDNQNL